MEMEYLKKQVKHIATCFLCHKVVQAPVKLPCLNIICQSHTKNGREFECDLCGGVHEVPVGGFKLFDRLNKFSSDLEYLTDAEKRVYKHLELTVEDLSKCDTELREKSANMELYVFERFKSLRCQVDLEREELKLKIDMECDKLIDKLKVEESLSNDLLRKAREINTHAFLDAIQRRISEEKRSLSTNAPKIDQLKMEIEHEAEHIKDKQFELELIKNRADSFYFEPAFGSKSTLCLLGSILGKVK